MTVIHAERLGKCFRSYRSEWHRIARWFGVRVSPRHEHWVLRDLSFCIRAGEAVGLVGRNGAGKSTLLRLLTDVMRPSTGNVRVQGRLAAILELGMGFNANLSGRQNVYNSASIMGYTADMVDQVIDRIAEFSELGDYFDQPVRVYSSGMQARLAFSVATAHRPDILVVDEALSVGDAHFQHKSFDRIRQFRDQGTTLLFVSHDAAAVLALCDRALLLEQGTLLRDGSPGDVLDYYNALIAEQDATTISQETSEQGRAVTRSGNGDVVIEQVALHRAGAEIELVEVGETVTLRVAARCCRDVEQLVMGYMIKDRLGQVMFGVNTHLTEQVQTRVCAGERIVFECTFAANVGPGSYSVSIALSAGREHLDGNYEWRDLALVFEVVNTGHTHFAGCAWIPPVIDVQRIPPETKTA
ncbi:MAG: ABC transporter ATP-binding protein [Halothiobacillaceae bacterium]